MEAPDRRPNHVTGEPANSREPNAVFKVKVGELWGFDAIGKWSPLRAATNIITVPYNALRMVLLETFAPERAEGENRAKDEARLRTIRELGLADDGSASPGTSVEREGKARQGTYLFGGGFVSLIATVVVGGMFPGSLVPLFFFAVGLVATIAGGIVSSVDRAFRDPESKPTPPLSRSPTTQIEQQLDQSLLEQIRPSQTPQESRNSARHTTSVGR
jgi:hypothetical protein